MPALQNDTLIRALSRQPTPYTPVWLMRQAGRYLPEYNETRRRAGSFLALCKTPALAAEVTLQPLERFPLDAAILFSDILTIPDAMGLGLQFAEGEGPRFERPLRDERQIAALAAPDPSSELRYVLDAVRQIRHELRDRVPTILFTKGGNPWLREIIASGVSAVGLDWTTDPRQARELAAGRVALQGNLDPATLFAPEGAVRSAARQVLDAFGAQPGHIFNLGHGISPKTPVDAVGALVDEVRAYSRARPKTNSPA